MKPHTVTKSWYKAVPFALAVTFCSNPASAQSNKSAVIDAIVKEENSNSQLEKLAHELLDEIGPRLVGTPQMKQANDWAVNKYKSWDINARNEQWGEWRGWERGISHIDMISPRVHTLEATQLAWSPGMGKKTVTAEVVVLPDLADSAAYAQWMPSVKGKIVMISMPQPTGRPDYNWQEFALKESFDKMKAERTAMTDAWKKRISKTGYTTRTLPVALENAGAAGVFTNTWSAGFGVDKIFSAYTKKVPTIDVALEDYTLLYRLIQSGTKPMISMHTESKELGAVPTFNTIAEIKGTEKPEEYVMLSAHFDSWDGGTGATDNGTGTLTMMEAMRLLKKFYPHPKRTILVGHWGSEEEGLNGSRAFVEDHPEIVKNLQALFNQDNGTGRVVDLSGQGFADAKNYLSKWLSAVPDTIKNRIKTNFPGQPGGGGSDFASFVAAGAPGFSLSSLGWSYGTYTWHTNRDTYDKIVFDDLRNNAMLAAIMAYMASEDPEKTSTVKTEGIKWPQPVKATRRGGLDK
ncbi:M20/M25/M40 family metallo-hydrolase [Mucilaginibacter sp. KACC 22063]|uniref:M20/M25/M40 family metallo-hydrolase n=1 Tax=Mucilaginibacter sp. KACC 22063 TaxID=3025666 RepID=UPI00236739B8|nr:M20/M25/M40 family metallo-hydrolase [Mucilaginibacter sp. KACC 22063]WDF57114.1 M20/M25/M40 family metallo-hydrolase [Mucilaginibacter sp. KACC 22063]